MTYNSQIGGHASGDLRDSFIKLMGRFTSAETDEDEAFTELTDSLFTTAGRLWNCTDIYPCILADSFEELGYIRNGYGRDDEASSYVRTARLIRAHIRKYYPRITPNYGR